MPPPLILQRCIAHGPLSRPFLATQIRHGSFTKQSIDKTVLVQLTKDVPSLGSRGDVVSVRRGRMRNMLYPYSMAQYIHPGAETFLTKNKLAIPVGPNYRRLLRKTEPDPLRQEYRQLFEDAKRRLSKEARIGPESRDAVLFKLDQMRREVQGAKGWKLAEKKRLLRFLEMQFNSWGMLEDSSSRVKKAKTGMLIRAWKEFTEEMQPKRKTAEVKEKKEGGLEAGASTAGTVIQGDVKTLKEGLETPVGMKEPASQTIVHSDSNTVFVPQIGEVKLSPFAVWNQGAEEVEKSQAVDETSATKEKTVGKSKKG